MIATVVNLLESKLSKSDIRSINSSRLALFTKCNIWTEWMISSSIEFSTSGSKNEFDEDSFSTWKLFRENITTWSLFSNVIDLSNLVSFLSIILKLCLLSVLIDESYNLDIIPTNFLMLFYFSKSAYIIESETLSGFLFLFNLNFSLMLKFF